MCKRSIMTTWSPGEYQNCSRWCASWDQCNLHYLALSTFFLLAIIILIHLFNTASNQLSLNLHSMSYITSSALHITPTSRRGSWPHFFLTFHSWWIFQEVSLQRVKAGSEKRTQYFTKHKGQGLAPACSWPMSHQRYHTVHTCIQSLKAVSLGPSKGNKRKPRVIMLRVITL